jgi:hypothetical protein
MDYTNPFRIEEQLTAPPTTQRTALEQSEGKQSLLSRARGAAAKVWDAIASHRKADLIVLASVMLIFIAIQPHTWSFVLGVICATLWNAVYAYFEQEPLISAEITAETK